MSHQSTATKRAKHAEIARRYGWHARQRDANSLASVRWAELVRLFRHRLGAELSRVELDRRIIAVAGDDWQSCGAWVIGRRVTLTLAERMTLGIRTMWPADKTRAQVKQAYAERKRQRDRDYRRRIRAQKRENARMNHDLSERQETLFALLRGNGKWMTVRQLAAAVRKWSAWKRPDGRAQKIASLRVLVRTELDALGGQGMIEQRREITRNGLPERRVRILENPINPVKRQKFVCANTRTGGVVAPENRGNADEMRVSNANKNVSSHGKTESLHPLSYGATTQTNGNAAPPARGLPTKSSSSPTSHPSARIAAASKGSSVRASDTGQANTPGTGRSADAVALERSMVLRFARIALGGGYVVQRHPIIPAWQLLLDGNEVSLHRRAEGAEAAAERRLQAVKAPSPAISTAVTQAELTAEEPVPDIALGLVTWDASHWARST